MKIGLTGMPQSGKTTIYAALCGADAAEFMFSSGTDPLVTVVDVLDNRITRLSEMYKPKKTTYATLELMDFPGNTDLDSSEPYTPEVLRHVRNVDALAVVLRNFVHDYLDDPDPVTELANLMNEFIMFDLIVAEKRIERIEWSYQRGQKTPELQREEKIIRRICSHLEQEKALDTVDLTDEERSLMKGYQFLTLKPRLLILNSDEAHFRSDPELLSKLQKLGDTIEFAGKFEMELSQMTDSEDIQMFMDDMGIESSARDRLTQSAYQILGYISFFTVGPDEVRAWNIHRGTRAVDAAGTIHSDLSRGFIRAECFHYDDLMDCGSEKGIRQEGRFRLEGRDYTVRDGDILSIRFNV